MPAVSLIHLTNGLVGMDEDVMPPNPQIRLKLRRAPAAAARASVRSSVGSSVGSRQARTTHQRQAHEHQADGDLAEARVDVAVGRREPHDDGDRAHGGGDQEAKYIDRANFVRILHDDGSMAVYAHLQPNSARVYPGGRVPTGAWIANSGNTGFSSGPHLHFAVQMNAGMSLESLPFRFRQRGGQMITPDRRMMLDGVLSLR